MFPSVGKTAPEFRLPDQNGREHSLSEFLGSWVLVYFYPKDDTPGCTTEACTIRDSYAVFKKNKIAVVGISADSVKSHNKFSEKFSLPFLLLADEKKEVVDTYGVWAKKKFMGREYFGILRTSFLVDPKGILVRVYEQVKPAEHAEEVLADVKNFGK